MRESQECLGGNGYVEDSIMPRLYRESAVNAIWEGSGNVIALDVLRAITKDPAAVAALRNELEQHLGADDHYDQYLADTWRALESVDNPEFEARRLTERLAIATQAALAMRDLGPVGSRSVPGEPHRRKPRRHAWNASLGSRCRCTRPSRVCSFGISMTRSNATNAAVGAPATYEEIVPQQRCWRS